MIPSEELKQAFEQFLSGETSKDFLHGIVAKVGEGDVDTLIDAVEWLSEPSDYCENDYDDRTVAGFFLYIDFISALVINLGEPAIKLANMLALNIHSYLGLLSRSQTPDFMSI